MSVSALSSSSSSYWEKMLAQMKGSSESQAQDNLASKLFGDLDSDRFSDHPCHRLILFEVLILDFAY